MSNLPVQQRRDPNEVFAFSINYIRAILAGKITCEAACDVLHRRFPDIGFDRAKAEYVRDKKRIAEKRAARNVMIIESCD